MGTVYYKHFPSTPTSPSTRSAPDAPDAPMAMVQSPIQRPAKSHCGTPPRKMCASQCGAPATLYEHCASCAFLSKTSTAFLTAPTAVLFPIDASL